MFEPTDLLVWAIIAHLVADWPLQTDWMVVNKIYLRHPAAWVHGAVHLLFSAMVFPWHLALLIAFTHILIDTRVPIDWWMRVIKRMPRDLPSSLTVEIWLDQVFHIMVLAFVVLFLT